VAMDPVLVKQQSAAFFAAADRCLTERPCGDETLWILPVPGIVCAALSIEIGFKSLLLQAGISPPREHKLSKLFHRLGPWQQNELVLSMGIDKNSFDAELGKVSDAFTQWRYEYENGDLEISIGFLEKLAAATQRVLNSANRA
jgi:HEPN domain-containing protein